MLWHGCDYENALIITYADHERCGACAYHDIKKLTSCLGVGQR